jgi:flagellar hook-associated protein 2
LGLTTHVGWVYLKVEAIQNHYLNKEELVMSSSSPISFSGVGSGIDVDSLVTRLMAVERRPLDQLNTRKNKLNLQQAQYDNLVSRVSALSASVKKITAPTFGSTDLFASKSATVDNKDLLSVTASSEASPQSFSVEVSRLATATKASTIGDLGQLASGSNAISSVAQGRISAGNFTVFLNGSANTVAVNTTDTLNDVLGRINALGTVAQPVTASIGTDGKISITSSQTVAVGANGDTSNFLDVTGLKTGSTVGSTLTGSLGLNTLSTNNDLTGSGAGLATAITAGSQFTIGKATFTVSAGKSLNALVSEINNTADAGVTASYNAASNKLELTAKTSGNSFITLKDEAGGNALAALGLIGPGGNSTTSQTQGLTAQFSINGGPTLQSSSNTVPDSLTGLTGITLSLTKADAGRPTQVNVTNNTADLKAAIKDSLNQLNTVFSFIQEQTNSQSTSAQLKNDNTILRFRSEIRSTLTSPATGVTGPFNNLGAIGISTGAVTGAGGSLNTTYSLDETKLDAALASNPENVKQLLAGTNGVFTKLSAMLTSALDTTSDPAQTGIFAKRKTTSQDQIKAINESIARAQTRLDSKEKLYRNQFQQMDRLISSYQSQSSAIARIGQQ